MTGQVRNTDLARVAHRWWNRHPCLSRSLEPLVRCASTGRARGWFCTHPASPWPIHASRTRQAALRSWSQPARQGAATLGLGTGAHRSPALHSQTRDGRCAPRQQTNSGPAARSSQSHDRASSHHARSAHRLDPARPCRFASTRPPRRRAERGGPAHATTGIFDYHGAFTSGAGMGLWCIGTQWRAADGHDAPALKRDPTPTGTVN